VAAGGANYVRNAPLDAELANRPYAGVSDADLQTMAKAYEGDIAQARGQLETEPSSSSYSDPGQYAAYDEKVAAFERFQRSNSDWKGRRSALFEREVTLEGLRREKSIRQRGLHKPWGRILRRITTL
jgi:hypothetical protein